MPRHATSAPSPRKILAWTAGSLAGLGLVGYIGGQIWLTRYLHSPEFRARIEERSGITLRAQVQVSPPRLENGQFFSNGFQALGIEEAAFSKVVAENIRGNYQMPSFLRLLFGERQVVAKDVEVQKFTAEIFPERKVPLSLPPRDPGEHNVKLENASVRTIQVTWKSGELSGSSARINAMEGGWKIEGENGTLLTDWGLPAFELSSARLVYKEKEKTVIVQEAKARAAGGEVTATGEFNPKTLADLQLTVKDVNVTPLLPEDWRARLHGRLHGEGRLKCPVEGPDSGLYRLSGQVSLKQGTLEALPVLNKIADYTRTEQFRRLPIDQLTGDFTFERKGNALRVTNLVLESRQLLKITGAFTILNGQIDGTFAFGITPSPLKWLPGAQEKVFLTQEGGYAWTTMRLTGAASSPKEDLSSRLVAAAGGAVVEKVEQTATKAADTAIDTGKKAATGVFDFLFGP